MQDAAPAPVRNADERREARRANIARLRNLLADMRVDDQGEPQVLEQAIQAVDPGAVARVREAVREFEDGRLTFKEWMSVHVPDWVGETVSRAASYTVFMAIVALIDIYMNPRPEEPAPQNSYTFVDPRTLSGNLLPMMATPNKGNGSVVDEVFAKARVARKVEAAI